jgi:hypothetical protein
MGSGARRGGEGAGAGVGEEGMARLQGAGARAWRGAVAWRDGGARELGEYRRRWIEKKKEMKHEIQTYG